MHMIQKLWQNDGPKEGWVYTLTCLKGYLENGASNLRAF